MPRRNQNPSQTFKRPRIPNYRNDELLGVCTEIYGGGHMAIKAEDGKTYLGVIRGKIRKRMWIRLGDLVLIQPWYEMSTRKGKKPKAHIIWRYTRTQSNWLKNHRYIKKEFLNAMQNI